MGPRCDCGFDGCNIDLILRISWHDDGATRGHLIALIMREMRLVLIGVVLGIGLSIAATRWVSSLLFGLEPDDPWSLSLAALLLIAVAAFAAYIPARRASRIDPLVALRFE